MKEYCVYNIWNGGSPFYSNFFNSYDKAITYIENMVKLCNERNYMYYVDVANYKNIYPFCIDNCRYMCIKERNVTDWVKHEITQEKNNIYYLF